MSTNINNLDTFNPAKSGKYDPGSIQVFYDNRTFAGFADALPFYQRYKLEALSRIGRADIWLPQNLEPGNLRIVFFTVSLLPVVEFLDISLIISQHVGTQGQKDFPLHKYLAVKEMFDSLSEEGHRPMVMGYSNENPFPMLGGVEPPPPQKKKEPRRAKTWSNHMAGHRGDGTPHERIMAIIQAEDDKEAKAREKEVNEWRDEKGKGGESERLV